MPKQTYFVHLDLLRVFFVFIVLLHHWVSQNPFTLLPFGSTIAFVLSSFLLTGPLLEGKKDHKNYWKITGNFLARRLLRTLPIYLLLLSIYILLNRHNIRNYYIYYLTFTQNYYILKNLLTASFGQTWSLAIQEQFYVVLPVIIYVLPNKYFRIFFGLTFFLGLGVRLWYFYLKLPFGYNHYTTESCIDCFSIGILISYYHYYYPKQLKNILSNRLILAIILVLYLCSTFGYFTASVEPLNKGIMYLYNNLYRITERTFVSLLSVWFIGWGIYYPNQKLIKISSNSIIKYLSKISYGIYIYHFAVAAVILKTLELIFDFTKQSIQFSWWVIILNFLFTIIFSILSYEFIEKPILVIKNRFFGGHSHMETGFSHKRIGNP